MLENVPRSSGFLPHKFAEAVLLNNHLQRWTFLSKPPHPTTRYYFVEKCFSTTGLLIFSALSKLRRIKSSRGTETLLPYLKRFSEVYMGWFKLRQLQKLAVMRQLTHTSWQTFLIFNNDNFESIQNTKICHRIGLNYFNKTSKNKKQQQRWSF